MEWKWEPIETAPKDDLMLLTDGGSIWLGFWQYSQWLTGYDNDSVQIIIKLRNITHWARVPDSPNATKEESKDA